MAGGDGVVSYFYDLLGYAFVMSVTVKIGSFAYKVNNFIFMAKLSGNMSLKFILHQSISFRILILLILVSSSSSLFNATTRFSPSLTPP